MSLRRPTAFLSGSTTGKSRFSYCHRKRWNSWATGRWRWRWRWRLLQIRCCTIFGWLVCHGQRTFRAFAYYLYRYGIGVRQAVGASCTAHSRWMSAKTSKQTLVKALAEAFKPYLTNQLATVEFPADIPDAIVRGGTNCFEAEEKAAEV